MVSYEDIKNVINNVVYNITGVYNEQIGENIVEEILRSFYGNIEPMNVDYEDNNVILYGKLLYGKYGGQILLTFSKKLINNRHMIMTVCKADRIEPEDGLVYHIDIMTGEVKPLVQLFW